MLQTYTLTVFEDNSFRVDMPEETFTLMNDKAKNIAGKTLCEMAASSDREAYKYLKAALGAVAAASDALDSASVAFLSRLPHEDSHPFHFSIGVFPSEADVTLTGSAEPITVCKLSVDLEI